ncbi:MAG: VWA domain-containing protein, partial [Planctomycetia bacterium]|nr:VWA domain-containing protein [Planctomycetia bacterium]
MTWSNPAYLLGFWLVAALIVLYAWSQRRTFRLLRTLVSENMSRTLLPLPGRTRAWVKGFFLLLALSLFCMTLAGPRFGFRIEKVARRGTDLFVLLDTSRSMLAEDVSPNRLAGAKLDIEDLLVKSGGDRVGLIAFAGKPVTQVPLTTDFGFFRDVLHRIDTETAPQGGTAIGDAVRLATRLLPRDPSRDKAIVLITDGEDHESMPLDAARDAAAAGVRIYTVAIGDFKEGARIPLFDKSGKRVGFEKYEGREVWSKADDKLLDEIAKISGGAFIPAGTTVFDLGSIYSEHLESLKRSTSGEEEWQVPLLQYQLFLLGGIVAFLVFLAISPYKEKTPVAMAANECFEQKQRAKSNGKSLPVASLILVLTLVGGAFGEETKVEPPAQTDTAEADIAKTDAMPAAPETPADLPVAEKAESQTTANESSV